MIVINLSLGLGLLFILGPVGVVAATVVSEGLDYLIRFYAVRSLTPSCRLIPRPLVAQLVAGMLMGVTVFVFWWSLSPTGWLAVFAFVLFGAMLYVGTVVAISSHFRATVSGILDDLDIYMSF